MYDILIKGAKVFDGTGQPGIIADVGITGDRITFIGHEKGRGEKTIDGTNQFLMPGVIDLVNHSDTHWTLFDEPSQESLLRQGVTSVFGGSCGGSLAPILGTKAIETIKEWVDTSRININWQTMEEYLRTLESQSFGVNYGTLVGHATLRTGLTTNTVKRVSDEVIDIMSGALKAAFDSGAFGISFGLAFQGIEYVSQYEIERLTSIAKHHTRLVSFHLRDEGKHMLPAVNEIIDIARSSGANVEISHFKAIGQSAWDDFAEAMRMILAARSEGVDINVDFFPYTRTGSLLYTFLPDWAKEGGREVIIKRLSNKRDRDLIVRDLQTLTIHDDRITIAATKFKSSLVGKTLQDAAKIIGKSPEETLVELLLVHELAVTIFGHTLHDHHILELMQSSFAHISSDGIGKSLNRKQENLIHPRSFSTVPRSFSYPMASNAPVTWEEVIRKMTYAPAKKIGLVDRGIIQKGAFADLVLFDPSKLKEHSTYEQPFRYPSGINWVFLNGKAVIQETIYRGALEGRILRHSSS